MRLVIDLAKCQEEWETSVPFSGGFPSWCSSGGVRSLAGWLATLGHHSIGCRYGRGKYAWHNAAVSYVSVEYDQHFIAP
jgi:hypothetical protein